MSYGPFMGDETSDFANWLYQAQGKIIDPEGGKPLPLLTELLYRVCDADLAKFDEAVDILRAAYEAGRNAVLKDMTRHGT